MGLHKAVFELVSRREDAAIRATESVGFREVATKKDWIRDLWGNHQDLAVLEMSLADVDLWWRF